MRLPLYSAAALCLLLCCHSSSQGQTQAAADPATVDDAVQRPRAESQYPSVGASRRPAGALAAVEEVKPETFVLPDGKGNLIPMPNWTYEAFMRAWKAMETGRQAAAEPPYSLEALECTGRVEGSDFIRLFARLEVRLRDGRRTRIPLAFPGGILDGYQVTPQDDSAYVYYDEDLDEHALWIAGAAGQSRHIELQLLLPLTSRGTQTVFKIHAPRTAKSSLTLDVPGLEVVAESPTNQTLVSINSAEGMTRIETRGLAETTEIAWRSRAQSGQGDERSMMAQSELTIHAERDHMRTEVNLTVHSLRGEFDRFRIRFPAQHTLVSQEMEQATLHPIGAPQGEDNGPPGDGKAAANAGSTTYEVRLARPQSLPFIAKLVLEQPLSLAEEGSEVTLSGVEVPDAVGQQGLVTLLVADELRVRWEEGHRIRQIATPRESVGARDVTAAFETDSGDWRLPLFLAVRRTEVSVVPDYHLEVGRDELRLTATFRFSVRGTLRQALRFALAGWELFEDPMGPESTIRRSSVYTDNAGTMYLSLVDPAEGSFETTLRLRMPRPTPSNVLQIRLPECLIEGPIQEGHLSVRADPSLEVIPQSLSFLGLSAVPPASPAAAPPAPFEGEAHEYRVASLPAEYVAVVRSRTRTIAHQSRVSVEVHADHVTVEQQMQLDVRHLPANNLVLHAPAALVANASASLAVAGESVAPPWDDLPLESGVFEGRILLKQPLTGPAAVQIRYQVPVHRDSVHAANPQQELVLPLVVPVADSHRLVATLTNAASDSQANFRASTGLSSDTTVSSQPVANLTEPTRIESAAPIFAIPVSIKLAPAASAGTFVVDRTWIQSRVVGDELQTWSAMRFVPATDQIVLDLGVNASPEDVHIEVNGDVVADPTITAGKISISLDESEQGAPCVVEIVQRRPIEPEWDGRLGVVPPRIAGARAYTSVYWQLVLPQSLHGFCTSEELVSDSPWRFQGAYWARVPRMSQGELEDLMGLPHDPRLPASVNQLLMAGLDLPQVLSATLVRRSTIVLVASGGILAAGIAILYFRRLQRWELVLAAAAVFAVAGILYPDVAPFIAQAGILGAALVLVSVFLKRLVGRWQNTLAGSAPIDTSIFPREAATSESTPIHVPTSEAPSSARSLVYGLTDSGAQHPA